MGRALQRRVHQGLQRNDRQGRQRRRQEVGMPSAARGRALGAAGRWLDPALALADRVALRAVWIGGALLLASAILVSVDVTIRKLFRLSVGGADELSGYAFA